jgi:hypothetical protein
MNPDAITFIGELGYTPREVAFLYAVGMQATSSGASLIPTLAG